ncbi:hypothetical protein DRF75_03955 [Ehrlichia minasensis]|uniref:Uncharacterized protein n=1 Tax=Ehrlichia minasensis TaxID=1242993 RepID=A0A4Q6I723_9RICK|nr:hypothetical protein [Ehrlichia minasensis]RZB12486.1 hypothetical protein DRF75_03955 [Ehrlichia minasensis]CEI85005.1 Uncharacterized protein ehr_00386 [Ehrlichia minasensis]
MDIQHIIIVLLAVFSFLFALFIAISIYQCCFSRNNIKEDYQQACIEEDTQKELELLRQRNKELEDVVGKLDTALMISKAGLQKQHSEVTKLLEDLSNVHSLAMEVTVLHKNLADSTRRIESDTTKSSREKLQCLSAEVLVNLYKFCNSVLVRGKESARSKAMAQDLRQVENSMLNIIAQLTEEQQLQSEGALPTSQVLSTAVSSCSVVDIDRIE